MARVAFLLMAHKDASRVIAQAEALTAHGDFLVVHFDASASSKAFAQIRDAVADNPNVTLAKRVNCGWGEYSLVKATLELVRAARRAFDGVTHYFLMSGDCYPTKSRDYFDRFLTDDRDHIEAHDFFDSDWIRTGMTEDRLIYRHLFNEREQKWLFYTSLELQRKFGLSRSLPKGVRICIGSQWWALRADTVEKILAFLDKRPDVTRFFSTTWIPDETFFQTLVSHVVPQAEISMAPPTHLIFSDYGLPVVFHHDHLEMLRGAEQPMARKISAASDTLRDALLDVFRSREADVSEGGGRRTLYHYLSARGRTGDRYAKRFWEHAIGARQGSELLIIVCKLWHVGKAVETAIASATGLPRLGYVFDEDLPIDVPLGGLENGIAKRSVHRKAMINLLYDSLGCDRLVLAADPQRLDVIDDLAENVGSTRILLIDRPLDETYFQGHAERVGLLTENSGPFERREVHKAIAHEYRDAVAKLTDRYRGRLFRNDLSQDHEQNVVEIGHFLRAPRNIAEAIACEAEKHVS